ncbi:HAD-IA family hydrolase [Sphingomonas sp. H39-1-10]|uniref:HAD-IA family hydrolase n=1 Tax=Sphingomonas pollutisoli TaxID=3030829 RepID=UPI0023B993E2|nr:HAD-IA family hydrolase [Sphingomonas pollutisoli]MDF0488787.1 HAD-IA family hydrolase [Sphingomonas pollutisoli]
MTDFSFDIVGFDLDGTLVDSSGDLAAAVNVMLAHDGRPTLAVRQVVAMTGGGVARLVRLALEATGGAAPDEAARLQAVMLASYEANIAVLTRPYPGAVAAIETLRARGVQVAIVTNKLAALSEKLLAELGLRGLFDIVIGGDTMGPGKQKPDPAPIHEMVRRAGGGRTAFVGDTMFDVTAARHASVPVVVVNFGREPVDGFGADAVIDHFDALIPTLETLHA